MCTLRGERAGGVANAVVGVGGSDAHPARGVVVSQDGAVVRPRVPVLRVRPQQPGAEAVLRLPVGPGIRVRDLCVRAPLRLRAGVQRRRRVHGQLQLAAGGAHPGGFRTAPQDVQVEEVMMSCLWAGIDEFQLYRPILVVAGLDWIGLD